MKVIPAQPTSSTATVSSCVNKAEVNAPKSQKECFSEEQQRFSLGLVKATITPLAEFIGQHVEDTHSKLAALDSQFMSASCNNVLPEYSGSASVMTDQGRRQEATALQSTSLPMDYAHLPADFENDMAAWKLSTDTNEYSTLDPHAAEFVPSCVESDVCDEVTSKAFPEISNLEEIVSCLILGESRKKRLKQYDYRRTAKNNRAVVSPLVALLHDSTVKALLHEAF